MSSKKFAYRLWAGFLIIAWLTTAAAQNRSRAGGSRTVPAKTLLRLIRAEDQRRWDDNLKSLLADKDAKVRKRAALAAGRIGDERAVPALVELLEGDSDNDVRQMVAFALGEIEAPTGADALIVVLDNTWEPRPLRGRAIEALGKIGAVLLSNESAAADKGNQTKVENKPLAKIRLAILDALKFDAGRPSLSKRETVLVGLSAVLRAKPEGAGSVVSRFLGYADPRIVADALNTMARLRLKDNNEEVRTLLRHSDPNVRANAARVIGAVEDKGAFDALLDRALHDGDLRVRVSAIRALGSLKDERAAAGLLKQGETLFKAGSKSGISDQVHPTEQNELLEIATTLGRLSASTSKPAVRDFLLRFARSVNRSSPEVEVALARLAPAEYWADGFFLTFTGPTRPLINWRTISALSQGLSEAATQLSKQWESGITLPEPIGMSRVMGRERTEMFLSYVKRKKLFHEAVPYQAIPDVLRGFSAYKSENQKLVLTEYLGDADVIIRATAAELLGGLPPDKATESALIAALPNALRDKDNDAALAILDALGKQKSAAANDAIKTGLNSSDHLIRRRAVALLKANGAGDFSRRIGYVQTRNTEADYRRAVARIGRKVTATVVTSKGSFVIEFLPEDAPLTVDNFVMLARKGYFNGQTIPRVVPNFVVQAGDPRGDQNGGPGYSIRCEINEAPYDRAAVGMALSGKDTGGSQWFVTHSPQPHLDGGYTVFGRVVSGMDVVDKIARGDTIRRVIVNER